MRHLINHQRRLDHIINAVHISTGKIVHNIAPVDEKERRDRFYIEPLR